MNDDDKAKLLIRFVEWWGLHSDLSPSEADVYRFLETNR